jgi:hypothetical protein
MADPLARMNKLAKRARLEKTPSVDVSGRVLASIRSREAEDGYRPLQWLAFGSAVAAAAMTLSVVPIYETWSEPLYSLFLDLVWGLL